MINGRFVCFACIRDSDICTLNCVSWLGRDFTLSIIIAIKNNFYSDLIKPLGCFLIIAVINESNLSCKGSTVTVIL